MARIADINCIDAITDPRQTGWFGAARLVSTCIALGVSALSLARKPENINEIAQVPQPGGGRRHARA